MSCIAPGSRFHRFGSGFHRTWRSIAVASALLVVPIAPSWGISIMLDDFQLAPATRSENTLDVRLTGSGFLGTSRDTSRLTGSFRGMMELDLSTGAPIATGLTFTGGLINAEDMSFSFVGGLLSASTSNVAGVPFTDTMPGSVSNGVFDASEHGITLNQGTVTATTTTLDLAESPLVSNGSGQGLLTITPIGMPVAGSQTYNLRMSLPVVVDDAFLLTGLPVVGDATIDIDATGTIVAEQTFVLGSAGDYDHSGSLDCADIELLSEAIVSGSSDPQFDADGNGAVAPTDILFWVQSLRSTIFGDANLDGVVDDSDWSTLDANLFTNDLSWCKGDFNVDGQIDVSDFDIWNSHRGLMAASSTAAVPEPRAAIGLFFSSFALWARMRKSRRPNEA